MAHKTPNKHIPATAPMHQSHSDRLWTGLGTAIGNHNTVNTEIKQLHCLACITSTLGLMLQLAIYSPADRLQPHRYKADESYEISGPDMTPVQSYLAVEAIIALAKQQNVDAIHPGYGFLSENTTFARRCGEEGIVFVGPSAKTIEVRLHLL